MRYATLTLLAALAAAAQQMPDVAAQKAAMQKLSFLVGTWKGEGTAYERNGPVRLQQTEEVQYKLDGLVLLIEGTGRDPQTGRVIFNALATVSYDDAAKAYHFRSHNGGRLLDTDLKVLEKGFSWGYEAGPAKLTFTMKLNEKGEWSEIGEAVVGGGPPRKSVELLVTKQ